MNKSYSCDSSQFSSYLAEAFSRFVEYKVNACGYIPDSYLQPLKLFDAYCCGCPQGHISLEPEVVLGYVDSLHVNNATARRYLSAIRAFSEYLILVEGIDPAEVYVPARVVRRTGRTFRPYVFTKNEVASLLRAAEQYEPAKRGQPTTNLPNCMRCIMAMLYCTGMRAGEVSYLLASEVDTDNGIIHINHAKNDNRRIVTMSPSLVDVCRDYTRLSSGHRSSGLYYFDTGAELNDGRVQTKTIYKYFRRYLKIACIEHKGRGCGPRLHDLRVTFAVHSLQRLTENAIDVNAYLYYLQTYMGHASLRETQDYLWLTGESFRPIWERMENCAPFIQTIFEEKERDPDYE